MSELLRLAFEDGTTGYAYDAETVKDAAAGSWEMANSEPRADIEWIADDLDDDFDDPEHDVISVDVVTLVELLRLARIGAQYAGCSVCRRVTLV